MTNTRCARTHLPAKGTHLRPCSQSLRVRGFEGEALLSCGGVMTRAGGDTRTTQVRSGDYRGALADDVEILVLRRP